MLNFDLSLKSIRAWLRRPFAAAVLFTVLVTGMASAFLAAVWQEHLFRHSPSDLNAVTGQIAAMTTHGHTVYVRVFEKTAYDVMFVSGYAVVAIGLTGSFLVYGFKGARERVPGLSWILLSVLTLVLATWFALTAGAQFGPAPL